MILLQLAFVLEVLAITILGFNMNPQTGIKETIPKVQFIIH